MKIAVSGTHRTGKSTLVQALCSALPNAAAVDEPYYTLLAQGHLFNEFPSVDEFELMLECSISQIQDADPYTVFDRCALDIVAYLLSHPDAHDFEASAWFDDIQNAMSQLDLLVFVPIEQPDRINQVDPVQDHLRLRVHNTLQELIFEDIWSLEPAAIEVKGTVDERLERVLQHIQKGI